jgi:hypothetical protein
VCTSPSQGKRAIHDGDGRNFSILTGSGPCNHGWPRC